MILTAIGCVIVVAVAIFVMMDKECKAFMAELRGERERLWQLISDLEADKRALTESLCRAEGKPFLPSKPAERQPSEGWFDGRPSVRITS